MIPREWLKKIRQIEMRTVRLVEDLMAGQYHSVTRDMRHVWGTIAAGEPVTSEQAIDLDAVVAAAAPDLVGSPYGVYRLAASPAIFFGFSAPPARPRFWTRLVRASEIV